MKKDTYFSLLIEKENLIELASFIGGTIALALFLYGLLLVQFVFA